MYDNIGKKIKGLAKALFIILSLMFVLYGATFIMGSRSIGSKNYLLGLSIILGGPLVAWISSWVLYGFGELVDKTCDIAEDINIQTGNTIMTTKNLSSGDNEGEDK